VVTDASLVTPILLTNGFGQSLKDWKNTVRRKLKTNEKRPWKGISEKNALERHLRPIRRKSCCEYSRLLMLLLLVY